MSAFGQTAASHSSNEYAFIKDIIIPVAVVVIAAIAGYVAFRVKVESRFKDVEHAIDNVKRDVEQLKPFNDILVNIGREQVEKAFRARRKP